MVNNIFVCKLSRYYLIARNDRMHPAYIVDSFCIIMTTKANNIKLWIESEMTACILDY